MDRPSSAAELREQLRAETVLAKIALYEDLAQLYDTAAIRQEREMLSERYRAYVGVLPRRREEFRAALQQILAGDGGSVEHVKRSLGD